MDFASAHEDSPRGRVEGLNGPLRRRRYCIKETAALVAASLEPGASVSELARRRGMHSQVLFAWRWLAREGKLALPAGALSMFAAVLAADDAPPVEPAPSGGTSGAGSARDDVIIELGAARRRRVGPDVAPARVAALVSVLRAA